MPLITDWLMLVITAVYVVATIFICWANICSANASKAQLEEMRKQYNQENRPNIEVEFLYSRRTFYGLRFVNHGKCTAHNVKILLDSTFVDSLPNAKFSALLRKQDGKVCVIGVGQHFDLYFGSNEYLNSPNKSPAKGRILYWANGIEYESEFYIDMESYATIFSVNSEQEDLIKKLKEQNSELNGIKEAIRNLKLYTNEKFINDKSDAPN